MGHQSIWNTQFISSGQTCALPALNRKLVYLLKTNSKHDMIRNQALFVIERGLHTEITEKSRRICSCKKLVTLTIIGLL